MRLAHFDEGTLTHLVVRIFLLLRVLAPLAIANHALPELWGINVVALLLLLFGTRERELLRGRVHASRLDSKRSRNVVDFCRSKLNGFP